MEIISGILLTNQLKIYKIIQMKFKNARDVVYRFKNEQTLKKFIWEQIGKDFILNEGDIWLNGNFWCIRSSTLREIANRKE